jgi:hypothetical protein
MAQKFKWILEAEAAKMLNVKPVTLRKNVKNRKIPIGYTSVRGRNFQYNELDIVKLLSSNAVS